jgi:hypothetical protein
MQCVAYQGFCIGIVKNATVDVLLYAMKFSYLDMIRLNNGDMCVWLHVAVVIVALVWKLNV